jgi:peptidoglycan LD-endopeptidase CwlK
MIASRQIRDLRPDVAAMAVRFLSAAKAAGIDLIVTSTYRDPQSQDELYAQGRTRPGKIVTRSRGWQSWHQYRVAFDVVPVRNGKPCWNDAALWGTVGAIGEAAGLEWGGRWKGFVDRPHFQFADGKTQKQLRAEMRLDK